MRKLIPYLIFIWMAVGAASAQATLAGTAGTYGLTAIPGETIQPLVIVSGGTLNTCTVSTTDTNVTIVNPNNQCTAKVTFSSAITGASCTNTSSSISSSVVKHITFTSLDSPYPAYIYAVNICGPTQTVTTLPAHRDTWTNTPVEVQSFVWAWDETGTWSISGTGCSLSDTTNRDTLVTGTTVGTCTVTYTATAGGGTSTAYVDIQAAPPTYALTSGLTLPQPCSNNVGRFTTVVDIGPGQTYTTIAAAFTGTPAAGTLFRLHYQAIAYYEYLQVFGNGTRTAPIRFCGVPDSSGNMPVMDGTNATGAAIFKAASVGLGEISFNPSTAGNSEPFGVYQNGNGLPQYWEIAGIQVQNVNIPGAIYLPGSPYVTSLVRSGNVVTATMSAANRLPCGLAPTLILTGATGGTTNFNGTFATTSCGSSTVSWNQTGANESAGTSTSTILQYGWGYGASGIRHTYGSYNSIIGNYITNASNCIFVDDNGSQLWAGQSLFLYDAENRLDTCGNAGQELFHADYNQGWFGVVEKNLVTNYAGAGNAFKIRALETIFRYNVINTAIPSFTYDYVDEEDDGQYMNINDYIGSGIVATYADSAGANVIAQFNAAWQKDLNYGNVCTTGCPSVHYIMDHPATNETRQGTLWSYSNTFNQIGIYFDTSTGSGYGPPVLVPQVFSANNVLYNTSANAVAFLSQAQSIGTWQTNVIAAGNSGMPPTISLAVPQYGGNYNAYTAYGWPNGCDYTCYIKNASIDLLQSGYTSANFITSVPQPFHNATLAPISGSVMLNAATPMTGFPSTSPVRIYWDEPSGLWKPRTDISTGWPTTVGAVSSSGSPTLVSIAVTPNPATVVLTGTQVMTATGTFSDSSTPNLTSVATWDNGSSPYFDVSRQFYQYIQTYGTGTGGGSGTASPTVAGGMSICGESCSGGATTGSYTFAFNQASPSLSGDSVALTTTGVGYNAQVFTNGLDCTLLPGGDCSGITDIQADVYVYIPSTTSTPEAIEGPNVVLYTGTNQMYPSFQCRGTGGHWWIWDSAGATWVDTGSTCTMRTLTNTWHHLHGDTSINQGANTFTYNSFTVDGTNVPLGGTTTFSGQGFVSGAALKAQNQIGGALTGSPTTTLYYDNWNASVSPGTPGVVTGISPGSGTVTATYTAVSGSATVNDVTGSTSNRIRQGFTVMR